MDIPSRAIYVGSIPYDQTEEQILDIFKTVGPVANIRLVFDKESGKSKGFGFVEYVDPGSAASAVRNLNNYQIGNRSLKVDFSRETSITSPFSSSVNSDLLASLPAGTPPPPGVAAHDAINKTLMTLTRDQMLGIILDLKTLSQKNPTLAKDLFTVSPQLSYMVVQSMLMLGIVESQTAISLVGQPAAQQQYDQGPHVDNQSDSNSRSQPSYRNTPPPPPAPQPQPPQEPEASQDQNQEADLIRKVMELTDEQVSQLSKEQQDALNVLRAKVRNGEYQL